MKKTKHRKPKPKKSETILTGEPENPELIVFRKYLADHNCLCEATKDRDFVKILKEILLYWRQKEVRYKREAGYPHFSKAGDFISHIFYLFFP